MRHRITIRPGDSTTVEPTPWPDWARDQLNQALTVAERFTTAPRQTTLAGELYHEWFTPPLIETPRELLRRPLAGLYRQAHAGTSRRTGDDEIPTIDRSDAIGRDRWWRTWGPQWTPARGRASRLRLLFSPRMEVLSEFVAMTTSTLLGVDEPWLIACPTLPSRLRHSGSVVVYLPDDDALRQSLVAGLAPYLRVDTPPLCLPLGPGVALAEHPNNGMTFGEHRCHLVALAIDRRPSTTTPLRAIADMFDAHGVSPAEPHRGNDLG